MKIEKEIVRGIEEYFNEQLKRVASKNVYGDAKDHNIDVAYKLSQLLMNIRNMQEIEIRATVMDGMKDLDFSQLDLSKFLNGIVKE